MEPGNVLMGGVEEYSISSIDGQKYRRLELEDPEFHDMMVKWFNGGSKGRRMIVAGGGVTITGGFMEAASEHIGRNDPCLCGSGKKYKKCCGVGK